MDRARGRDVTIQVNNGTGFTDYQSRAVFGSLNERDLVPGSTIRQGDVKLIISSTNWPDGAPIKLEMKDRTDQCVLLDFIASVDQIRTIGDPDNLGFRENGTVAVHWLAPTGFESGPVLAAADNLRLALRGRVFDYLRVEEVEPFSDSGSPIDVDGRWTGFSSLISYELDSFG